MTRRFFALTLLFAACEGFTVLKLATSREAASSIAAKGFGKEQEEPPQKAPSAAALERQQAVARYDNIAATGGQEYKIFIRQFGSDGDSWLPCGSIAVPRNAQVSNAIQANLDNLKASIVRTYPKLVGQEDEFEFGYNLKIYPDDPVEVANLNLKPPTQGFSIQNWISTLLSPVDASGVAPPPIPEDK